MSALSTSPDQSIFKPRRNYGRMMRRIVRLHPNMLVGAILLLVVIIGEVEQRSPFQLRVFGISISIGAGVAVAVAVGVGR